MERDWFDRSVRIEKSAHGHKVYVDGQEVAGVKRVAFDIYAQEVPTVTLEIAAPTIEVEYDNRVYKK